jgi:cytochrome bd ubiquinol oxidase subunit II
MFCPATMSTGDRSWVFNATSAITPFLFGIIAAAVASENIRVQGKSVETDLATSWLLPFALAVDVMAVAL